MKNRKRTRRALQLALIVGLSLALQGCPEREGPMEQAGEAVDEAAQDAERKIDDATD